MLIGKFSACWYNMLQISVLSRLDTLFFPSYRMYVRGGFNIAIIYDVKLLHVQFIYTINYCTLHNKRENIFQWVYTQSAYKASLYAWIRSAISEAVGYGMLQTSLFTTKYVTFHVIVRVPTPRDSNFASLTTPSIPCGRSMPGSRHAASHETEKREEKLVSCAFARFRNGGKRLSHDSPAFSGL